MGSTAKNCLGGVMGSSSVPALVAIASRVRASRHALAGGIAVSICEVKSRA